MQKALRSSLSRCLYESDAWKNGTFTKSIKLKTDGSDCVEWTLAFYEAFGRLHRADPSGGGSKLQYYNALGQLANAVDAAGVSAVYAYNGRGEREYSVIDMDRDGSIDWAGTRNRRE